MAGAFPVELAFHGEQTPEAAHDRVAAAVHRPAGVRLAERAADGINAAGAGAAAARHLEPVNGIDPVGYSDPGAIGNNDAVTSPELKVGIKSAGVGINMNWILNRAGANNRTIAITPDPCDDRIAIAVHAWTIELHC